MADPKGSTGRLRPRLRHRPGHRGWFRPRTLILALILLLAGICLSPGMVAPPPQWPSIVSNSSAGIRALILTAHPDDECMFFSPTILSLVKQNAHVKSLCLSSGMLLSLYSGVNVRLTYMHSNTFGYFRECHGLGQYPLQGADL